MNAHRLLTLAAFLDHVDAKRFNMMLWGSHTDLNVCGSSGCAIGWATTIPEFRAAGLCLENKEPGRTVPLFQGSAGFHAVEEFFDIEENVAGDLFSTRKEFSPSQVAAHIRRFVASDPTAAAFIAEVEQQANERAAIVAEGM